MRRLVWGVTALTAALLGAFVGMGPAEASVAPATVAIASATTQHVIVVGVPGLRWEDVSKEATPQIWSLVDTSTVGSLSVRSARSRTCPGDGWVQLTTGNRAQGPDPTDAEVSSGTCPAIPEEQAEGAGARVQSWPELIKGNDRLSYDAVLGLMGQQVKAHTQQGCVAAAGKGAAIGGADRSGHTDRWLPDATAVNGAFLNSCALTVVGSDALLDGARTRAELAAVDQLVGKVVNERPEGSLLLVVGLSEVATERAQLHVAMASGPMFNGGELISGTTRRAPFAQLSDVAPTVLQALGIAQPKEMPYRPWRQTEGARASTTAAEVNRLVDLDLHALRQGDLSPPFFSMLVILQVLLYLAAYLALRRLPRRDVRHDVLTATHVGAVASAAGVVSTYVANLVPWWRPVHPLPALLLAVGVSMALITAIAFAGPWRRHPYGPAGAVAVTTALVMAVDVVTGARLQLSSLAGYSPIVGGRFAGFGNLAFAVFAAGALLGTAAVVKGRDRRTTLVITTLAGLAAVALDGAPKWGSDFGGVIALVPSFAVLAMLAAGIRVSWRRFLLVCLAGIAVVALIAFADYLRPEADRTHLGGFVAQIADGTAWTVVRRKLDANITLLTRSVLTALVPIVVLFLAFLMRKPGTILQRAFGVVPTLRAGLLAVLTMGVIGGLANDSGIAIPAMAACVAVPIAVAVSVRVLQLESAVVPTTPAVSGRDEASDRLLG